MRLESGSPFWSSNSERTPRQMCAACPTRLGRLPAGAKHFRLTEPRHCGLASEASEACVHAGLSVLQQAAEYGYSSTVYTPQLKDAQPKMPGWAWLLVAIAVLSISVAGEACTCYCIKGIAQGIVHAKEATRARTVQATTVLASACQWIPDCPHQIIPPDLKASTWAARPHPSLDKVPDSAGISVAAWYHLHRSELPSSVSHP